MAASQPPPIGLIVHYYHNNHSAPQLGIVASVLSPRAVNLALWDERGRPWADPPTGIRFVGEGERPPATGAWCRRPPEGDAEAASAARQGFEQGNR